MRVLHVIPSLDPADGGPPVVVIRLAAAQAAAGAEVSILFYERPDAHDHVRNSIEATPGGQRLHLQPLPAPTPVERFTASAATHALRPLLRDDADFLHVHGIWTPILAAAAKAAARAGIPYCITPHGMLDPWRLGRKRLKKQFALALVWRRLVNSAAFIQALNRDEVDAMSPLGITPPTVVIPNGIFVDEFDHLPPRGTFRAAHPELADDPYVVFLSRLHPGKGLDLLAAAFPRVLESVPNARLVIVGPDAGALAPLQRQIEELRIAERTHIVGPLYGQDKLAALHDATCFCLPSRHEAFSIAITEALACGLPCVVSEECHYPELADAGAGRIVKLDPNAIGEAVADVLANTGLAADMGRAGWTLVRERFTWPRIAERSLEAYRDALLKCGKSAAALAGEPQA